jgi:hypothetical protein
MDIMHSAKRRACNFSEDTEQQQKHFNIMSVTKTKNTQAWLGYTLVPYSTPCSLIQWYRQFGSTLLHEIWAECCQTPLLLPTPRMKCSGCFAPWVGSRKGPLPTIQSAPVNLLHYPTTRLTSTPPPPPQPPFSPSLLRLPHHPSLLIHSWSHHDSWEEHNQLVSDPDPCNE